MEFWGERWRAEIVGPLTRVLRGEFGRRSDNARVSRARGTATIPRTLAAFDPARDLAELRALYDEIEGLRERDAAFLAALAPARSAWSIEQHLAHVALANELVLRNIASLVAGKGALIVRDAAPDPRALEVLVRGYIPRGVARSPRMVRPPERVDPALLLQWLADGRAALEALDPATVVATELRIPHQLLGPLDAPQWARFGAVHTRHHLEIVREIAADRISR